MHMARLWDSSRTGKGYSLEALTHDAEVMNDASDDVGLGFRAKLSMKKRFGKPNQKKDGTDGKLVRARDARARLAASRSPRPLPRACCPS
jgi:hypothetical protein